MPGFRPATLIELIDDEPSGKEIDGQAIMWVSRNERGSMEASGTFKIEGAPYAGEEQLTGRAFQYEGLASEAGKDHDIRALVLIVSVHGDLYELEALTEPVVVQKIDATNEPITVPERLEHRD